MFPLCFPHGHEGTRLFLIHHIVLQENHPNILCITDALRPFIRYSIDDCRIVAIGEGSGRIACMYVIGQWRDGKDAYTQLSQVSPFSILQPTGGQLTLQMVSSVSRGHFVRKWYILHIVMSGSSSLPCFPPVVGVATCLGHHELAETKRLSWSRRGPAHRKTELNQCSVKDAKQGATFCLGAKRGWMSPLHIPWKRYRFFKSGLLADDFCSRNENYTLIWLILICSLSYRHVQCVARPKLSNFNKRRDWWMILGMHYRAIRPPSGRPRPPKKVRLPSNR